MRYYLLQQVVPDVFNSHIKERRIYADYFKIEGVCVRFFKIVPPPQPQESLADAVYDANYPTLFPTTHRHDNVETVGGATIYSLTSRSDEQDSEEESVMALLLEKDKPLNSAPMLEEVKPLLPPELQ